MAEIRSGVNISIGANADVLERVLSQAQKKATDFERNLTKAAVATAAAYGAIKVAVLNSLEAFAEQERIGNQLTQVLVNQGIYTKELRESYDRLSATTGRMLGIDDDAVKLALAKSQAYLGNIEITDRLTEAAANLAVATGDSLDEAMVKIAKSVTTNTNALAKLGIEVSQSVDDHTRLEGIVTQLEARWGGQARASGGAAVAFSNLRNAAGDLYEEIGERLAPVAVTLAKVLTNLLDWIKENRSLVTFIATVGTLAAGILAAISAVSGLISAFGVLSSIVAPVLPLIAAAATAVGVAFSGIPIAITAAVALVAAPIALLLAQIKSVRDAASGLGNSIKSFFGFGGKEKAPTDNSEEAAQQAKLEANRRAQQQIEQERRDHNNRLALIERNQSQISVLNFQENTKRLVDLKNQENQILKQLDETRNAQVRQSLQDALSQNRQQQELEQQERLARIQQFAQIETQAKADAMALGFQIETDLTLAQRNQLLEGEMTEAEAKRQIYQQMIRDRIEANNRFLQEQAKFGTAFATINRAIQSEEVQGAKSASNELIGLTQSKNATLKAIGKAAAVTNIAIATAESAMNIFKGFSALPPPFGQILGSAGAAAAIAFGAERTAQVLAAAQGGLVTGGVAGVDSVPAMLTPGELVVPKQNFNEVVGAVQSARDGGGMGEVVSELQALRTEIGAVRPNLVTINGDVMSDDSFVDRLIQKISDRLEFGNARLVGVTS